MKLRLVILLCLFMFSLMGLAQRSGSDSTAGNDGFDLDTLVDRVSHSKHLGFFTKISLKQDIDQLLEGIRKYYNGTGETSLERARERYDVLVHKLIVLLQDKDQMLAKSIEDGREPLWTILSDEKKFAGI